MKQADDNKTIDLPLEPVKRGRGRPVKPDALTPAERAKRYRDAKRAAPSQQAIKRDEKKVTEKSTLARCIELQKMLDLEHLALVNALNRIAELELAATKPPKINPLAAEVRSLKRELKRRDEKHAEQMRLTREEYESKSSRK